MTTHDFRHGHWGHDILLTTFVKDSHPQSWDTMGVGSGIGNGDEVVLALKAGGALVLKASQVKYNENPPDVFHCVLTLDRQFEEQPK